MSRGGGRDGGTRVYVGNVSSRTRERDLDDAFYKFGPITRIDLKNGFAFIEFEDDRDANDAVRRMDGEMIEGRKVQVEASRGGSGRPADSSKAQYPRGGRGGGYRVEAEGLDQRVSWQDLKDFARDAGNVAFTDVWSDRGEKKGVIEYTRKQDMEEALRKLHDTKMEKHGCYIKLYQVKSSRSKSGSRSRSRSPKKSRKHSRSRSRSPKKKSRRSPSRSRSRSRSPKKEKKSKRSRSASKSRSKSRSRSRSKDKKDKKDKEEDKDDDKEKAEDKGSEKEDKGDDKGDKSDNEDKEKKEGSDGDDK